VSSWLPPGWRFELVGGPGYRATLRASHGERRVLVEFAHESMLKAPEVVQSVQLMVAERAWALHTGRRDVVAAAAGRVR
jgi:hypothetical protein